MVCVLDAILGVSLGLFFSAFATTEFQAVQFAPIVLVPQLFLAGVFIPREEMPGWLQSISNALPLPYAVDALKQVSTHTEATPQMWRDVAVVAVFIVAALLGGAATLRRRTPRTRPARPAGRRSRTPSPSRGRGTTRSRPGPRA